MPSLVKAKIGSIEPFWSKSFTYKRSGSSLVGLNLEFNPIFPITKSVSPSLSISADSILFHHPSDFSRPGIFSTFVSFFPSFLKTVIGNQSPTTIRSGKLLSS